MSHEESGRESSDQFYLLRVRDRNRELGLRRKIAWGVS